MSAEALSHDQRITTLRNLSHRWIAEYPGILAADPERARHHAEGIRDLEQMIVALMGKPRPPSVPAVFESV